MVASMSFNPSFVSLLLCSVLDPDGHAASSTPKLFLLVHNSHVEKGETSWSYAVEMCGLVMWKKCSKLLVHVSMCGLYISCIFSYLTFLVLMARHIKVLLDKSCHSAAVLATPPGNYFWPSRPADNLNDWAEGHNFPFIGHKNGMYRVISQSL